MNYLDENTLRAKFIIDEKGRVQQPESDDVEYKLTFDWSNKRSRARYAKTLAAFANNKGGYLVFGVDNKSLVAKGVKNFQSIDISAISQFLIEYFSPVLQFQPTTYQIRKRTKLGIIYAHQHETEPIICLKDFKDHATGCTKEEIYLSRGDIYYRYVGLSEKIRPSELLRLFNAFAEKKISGAGTEQVKEFRRNDILPIFIWANGLKNDEAISDVFRNTGERAKLLYHREYEDNESYVDFRKGFVEKGQEWTIKARRKSGATNSDFWGYHVDVVFEDKDQRQYRQEISRKGWNKILMSEPIPITDQDSSG